MVRARARPPSRHRYYWLITQDPETLQPYLIFGSARSEDEARQKGLDVLSGYNFEVRALPTRNLAMASSMVRGKRLDETRSLTQAKKRIGHQKSVDRLQRRRQRRQNKYSTR